MPTPIEELRTAATKLRSHSEGAATAPWTVNRWGSIETARYEEVAEVWPLSNGDHNAAYVALMHPGVGSALADWLDLFAATEFDPEAGVQETERSHECALAVARAINGGQP